MGIEAMRDTCPIDLPADHLAYALETSLHEKAQTMLPLEDYDGDAYFTKMYDIRGSRPSSVRELGNVNPDDGALFCERG